MGVSVKKVYMALTSKTSLIPCISLHTTQTFPACLGPLYPIPTHCNHGSILCQTLPGIPSPSIPIVHPRATHCFIAQCCSLKGWNSPLHGVKSNQICRVKVGEKKELWRKICSLLLHFICFWTCNTLLWILMVMGCCTCFLAMKFIILLLFECIKGCC